MIDMRLRLKGEIEARHGARIEVLADAITGERMHVLDPRLGGWAARMYGWAAEELAGRRLPASPEQLKEEERDNARTMRRGSSRSWRSAASTSGRLGTEWRLRPLYCIRYGQCRYRVCEICCLMQTYK